MSHKLRTITLLICIPLTLGHWNSYLSAGIIEILPITGLSLYLLPNHSFSIPERHQNQPSVFKKKKSNTGAHALSQTF